jgi:hypothetical protein
MGWLKNAVVVLAGLSAVSCSPDAGSKEAAVLGAPPKKGNCNNPADWKNSPVTCQKDTNQVVVHEVYKVRKELSDELGRARPAIKVCFGKVSAWNTDTGKFDHDLFGVWLDHSLIGWGCRPGVGYTAHGQGPNKVSVLDYDWRNGSLTLLSSQEKSVGSFNIDDDVLWNLCTDGADGNCDIAKKNNTLVIIPK